MTKRTTVYLNSNLHHALRLKSVEVNKSLSDLVNEAVRFSLKEDSIDLQAVKDRAHEPARSFESVLKDLKRDGLL